MVQNLSVSHPGAAEHFKASLRSFSTSAAALRQRAAARTTNTNDTIPVVFHIVLDQDQINQMGGEAGIAQRVLSQMEVINRDYSALNADSAQIPTDFKPLFANTGIKFGLAHQTPSGQNTPGYEIITTTQTGFEAASSAFAGAKHSSSGGADAWDPTVYLNIWVANPSGGGILGLTISHSFASAYGFPANEVGVGINYSILGLYENSSQYFYQPYTLGRTLTHELGHFFELSHIWGDDNGLCPWDSGGADDNIADTPPQSDATIGRRTFPTFDNCSPSGDGIMYVNYMDYTDDSDMHMFTLDQTAVMQATIQHNNENYSLTQHPEVLHLGVSDVLNNNTLSVAPNPATAFTQLIFGKAPQSLQGISVTDILGRRVRDISVNTAKTTYTINLSGLGRGVYFIQCHFTEGSITRKIVLQ